MCNQAEKAVNEMEKAAFDQLQDQASQHEKSQMKVNEKLNKEYKRIKEYQFLIKVMFTYVLSSWQLSCNALEMCSW